MKQQRGHRQSAEAGTPAVAGASAVAGTPAVAGASAVAGTSAIAAAACAVVAGCCVAAMLFASAAYAAQIRSIDIDRESGRYTLYAETFLAARPEDIFEVLLDYDHFNRISSVYKEHGYLDPAPDGTPIIYTTMEGCMLFYCMSMHRVERLEAERPGVIRTYTLPEQSNFTYSTSEWTMTPEPGGTLMTYSLVMEPDFWVPPIIGPWYIKRVLQRGGLHAIDRIERLASTRADQQVAHSEATSGG